MGICKRTEVKSCASVLKPEGKTKGEKSWLEEPALWLPSSEPAYGIYYMHIYAYRFLVTFTTHMQKTAHLPISALIQKWPDVSTQPGE